VRNLRVDSSQNFLVKTLHVFCSKGRFQSNCFIKYTSQRPNVTFLIVRLISPYFWTCIIWCPSLGVKQTFFCNFGNIHVAKFDTPVFIQEHVGTFQVSVENTDLVQTLQTPNYLYEYFPNVVFIKKCLILLVISYLDKKISKVCIFHDNTKA
jgi:hypothetical protein